MDTTTTRDTATPLGTYAAGHPVSVLHAADGVAVVCLDLDHHPTGICHTARVPVDALTAPEGERVDEEPEPSGPPEPETPPPVPAERRPACEGHNPELWFVADGGSPSGTPEAWAPAAAICATCPLVDPCLARALDAEGTNGARSRFGMWGGKTPDERAELARTKTPERTGA